MSAAHSQAALGIGASDDTNLMLNFHSITAACSTLEARFRESQGRLHETRMERMALEDEVSALSVYAAATPLLEQEILVQGDRADALQEELGSVVAKNEALEAMAHLRLRARHDIRAADHLRCLAACLADLALQRAFYAWRWRFAEANPFGGGVAVGGVVGGAAAVGGAAVGGAPPPPGASSALELEEAEARLEALARREAALAYDNMRRRRSKVSAPFSRPRLL